MAASPLAYTPPWVTLRRRLDREVPLPPGGRYRCYSAACGGKGQCYAPGCAATATEARRLWLEMEQGITTVEETVMQQLPRKELLVERPAQTLLGVLDLLFAYAYDMRITDGEHSVESGWTIGTLSAMFSCLVASAGGRGVKS